MILCGISFVATKARGKWGCVGSQGFFAAEIGLYEARFILTFFAPGFYQIWSSFQVLSGVVHANQDSLSCIKICLKLVHFCFCRKLAFLTPSHHMAWENLAPFSHKHVCKHTIKAHKLKIYASHINKSSLTFHFVWHNFATAFMKTSLF